MTVTLQQSEYEVGETDGMVQVCVELTGVVERSVEILLNTVDDTATGKTITALIYLDGLLCIMAL